MLEPLDPLPDAPLPGDPQATFDSKAFPMVQAQVDMVDQLNAMIAELNIRLYGYNIQAVSGTTYTLDIDDAGNYINLSNASAKTITINDEAGGPDDDRVGKAWNFRNTGAGLATIVAGGSTAVTTNAGGTLTFAQHANVSIVCVAVDEYHVMGQTELA